MTKSFFTWVAAFLLIAQPTSHAQIPYGAPLSSSLVNNSFIFKNSNDTITGTKTFNGPINSNGSNIFTGSNLFSSLTLTGPFNSSGTNSFSGTNTFAGTSNFGLLNSSTSNVSGAFSVGGNSTLSGDVAIQGKLKVSSELQLAQEVNSTLTGTSAVLANTKPTVILTNSALTSIGGISGASEGEVVILINKLTTSVTMNENDSSVTAANRISTGAAGNISMPPDGTLIFTYNSTYSRWQMTGGSGGGLSILGQRDTVPLSKSVVKVPLNQATDLGTNEVLLETGNDNLFSNPGFENNSFAPWTKVSTTYVVNALPTSLVPGGGSMILGTTSTDKLDGNYSMTITKPASNVQGHGVKSGSMSIPRKSWGKPQSITFTYEVTSGTFVADQTNNQSLEFWLINDTNGLIEQPAAYRCINQIVGSGNCNLEFQPPGNTASSFSVLALVPNNAATAFVLRVDNFRLAPVIKSNGAVITSEQPTALTINNLNSLSNQRASYRQVGDRYFYKGFVTAGATGTAATFSIQLPPGVSIDYTKISTYAGGTKVGTIDTVNSSLQQTLPGYEYVAFVDGVTTDRVFASYQTQSGAYLKLNGNSTANAGQSLDFNFDFPVLGKSGTVEFSNDSDTRVISMRVDSAPNSYVNGTPAIYTNLVADTHGGWNPATGQYKIPVTGWYDTSGCLHSNGNFAYALDVFAGGSTVARLGEKGYTAQAAVCGSTTLFFNAGTLVDLRSNFTGTTYTSSFLGFFSITRAPGPSVIAASEKIRASYYVVPSPLTVVGGTAITFAGKNYDTHGIFNGTQIKINRPGFCTFTPFLQYGGAGGTVVPLYKNGVSIMNGPYIDGTVVSASQPFKVKVMAGETYEFRPIATLNLVGVDTNGQYSNLTIECE